MSEKRTVLVTGVADYWGGRVAARLVKEAGVRVIGVDGSPPAVKVEGMDFVQVDVRNPLLVEFLRDEGVETICHLTFHASRRRSEADFDLNVMGTMKVFGAAVEAGVKNIVVKSGTDVYGAQANNPAFLAESWPLQGSRNYGYTRYRMEIEAFAAGFAKQFPHISVARLRFANVVGRTVDSPMSRYLSNGLVPTLMGFNPMLQFVHEDDVVRGIAHAAMTAVGGAFNIGTEDFQPLAKVVRLVGATAVPIVHPLAYWGVGFLGGTPLKPKRYFPLDLDYLRYRWVGDTAKMRAEFGWEPRFTAVEALEDLAKARRSTPSGEAALAMDEGYLREVLAQRRMMKSKVEERSG